jgi:hypothetical protein
MNKGIRGPVARRENDLLRYCCRVSPAREVWNRIDELAQQPLDWSLVLSRSWWHRIRPLVFRHLNALPSCTMPDDVRQKFLEFVAELSARSLRLANTLSGVATLFEQANVRGLVFKGPTLAQDAYGDVTLRECGDLDLLIDGVDFDRMRQVLLDDGFRSCWDSPANRQQLFACEFARSDATLDVHWALAPGWLNYQVDFDRLWRAGSGVNAGGTYLRKLRSEDGVSVLCIHGTKHWWDRLRWLVDVSELINSGQIADWERVESTAAAAHCRRSVSVGLYLAADLLDAELPADVRHQLQRVSGIQRLAAQVRNWLEYAEGGKQVRGFRERFRFRMGVCERVRDQVPQIVQYLFGRSRAAH